MLTYVASGQVEAAVAGCVIPRRRRRSQHRLHPSKGLLEFLCEVHRRFELKDLGRAGLMIRSAIDDVKRGLMTAQARHAAQETYSSESQNAREALQSADSCAPASRSLENADAPRHIRVSVTDHSLTSGPSGHDEALSPFPNLDAAESLYSYYTDSMTQYESSYTSDGPEAYYETRPPTEEIPSAGEVPLEHDSHFEDAFVNQHWASEPL